MSEKFKLEVGQLTTVRNPNPANTRFEIKTKGGTWLSFALPAGASFDIRAGTDIERADWIIEDVSSYGPRSID